jgi:hypothetical protein
MVLAAAATPEVENPVFHELVEKGVTMSDGSTMKLPPPFLADGLDAAAQQAALAKLCDARTPLSEVMRKASSAPIVMKVRTLKAGEDEAPSIRAIDFWFVAHGDWNTLNSKEFLESLAQRDDDGKSQVVLKSGILTDEEMAKRKLAVANRDGREERFVYTTFSLFERVDISATRWAVLVRGRNSVLAAAKIDRRFDHDGDYPNQWRPWLRDERAEIHLGPAQPYPWAGGYAKITRLTQPTGAVVLECHLVYEEPYTWFDGANLVRQKAPLMVQEKARTFRRKLAIASAKKAP